jgi:hypothetical protein
MSLHNISYRAVSNLDDVSQLEAKKFELLGEWSQYQESGHLEFSPVIVDRCCSGLRAKLERFEASMNERRKLAPDVSIY